MTKIKTVVFFILLFAFLSSAGLAAPQTEVIEAIVAVVEGDIITLSEIRTEYRLRAEALRSQLEGEQLSAELKRMKANLLEDMITNKLLLQKAKQQGIDVAEQLNMQIESLKKENGFDTDAQLIQAMRQQGIVFEEWKQEMEENLLRQAVIFNEVGQSIVVDDTEVVNYYHEKREEFVEPAEYTIKAIYLSGENRIREEVQGTMDEISGKIQAGENFGALAAEYSDLEPAEGEDEESRGLLGSYQPGDLNRALEEVVEQLNTGEVSNWIEAQNGWWLLKLVNKKESRIKEFEEVREDIERTLYQQKQQQAIEGYISKMRENSYVKVIIENPLDF
jgi:parvulin-like peptidyl-prolyl isomerase